MIRSMTGFGRAEGVVKDKKLTAEFRSLNSRQLDLMLKLPSLYKEKEAELRQWIGERAMRGKVELYVNAELLHVEKRTSFDAGLVEAYYKEVKAIKDSVDPSAQTDVLGFVLRMPDVARTSREELDEAEWTGAMNLIQQAFSAYDEFRRMEGGRLHDDLSSRGRKIAVLLDQIDAMDGGRADRTRDRLNAKLNELEGAIDRDRFEQELVYYLEKLDVNEEKVRLRSHCIYFNETLEGEVQQGRKLGFITQEMGREINTIGSKANDATMQRRVVEMKDELEKIKEQLMNVL